MKNQIFDRMKQPSTWAGLASIAAMVLTGSPDLSAVASQLVLSLGLVLVDA